MGVSVDEAARVLIAAGYAPNTETEVSGYYARSLQGAVRYRTLEDAQASIERLEALYRGFRENKDRRGIHQVQMLALIGKNRAEGIGQYAAGRLFAEWLAKVLLEALPDAR